MCLLLLKPDIFDCISAVVARFSAQSERLHLIKRRPQSQNTIFQQLRFLLFQNNQPIDFGLNQLLQQCVEFFPVKNSSILINECNRMKLLNVGVTTLVQVEIQISDLFEKCQSVMHEFVSDENIKKSGAKSPLHRKQKEPNVVSQSLSTSSTEMKKLRVQDLERLRKEASSLRLQISCAFRTVSLLRVWLDSVRPVFPQVNEHTMAIDTECRLLWASTLLNFCRFLLTESDASARDTKVIIHLSKHRLSNVTVKQSMLLWFIFNIYMHLMGYCTGTTGIARLHVSTS